MARLQNIANKAAESANRIINFPALLVTKAFSKAGVTAAITRAARKAIRRDRLILASVTLVSLELGFLLIIMFLISLGLGHSNSWLEVVSVALRMVLIALTTAFMLFFRWRKVSRKHTEAALKREIAKLRRK